MVFFNYSFLGFNLTIELEGTKLVPVFKNRSVKHIIRDAILTRIKYVNRCTTTVTNE